MPFVANLYKNNVKLSRTSGIAPEQASVQIFPGTKIMCALPDQIFIVDKRQQHDSH